MVTLCNPKWQPHKKFQGHILRQNHCGTEQLRHSSQKMGRGSVKRSQGAHMENEAQAPGGDRPYPPTPHSPTPATKVSQREEPFHMSVECDFHRGRHSMQSHNPTLQSKKSFSEDSNPYDPSKNPALVDTEEKETVSPSVQTLQNACQVSAPFPGPRTS